MELHVVINGRKDLAGQLYNQLRSAIESGRLAAGTQLPPSRLLAEQLGISRTPLREAIARLERDGLVHVAPRKGVYVQRKSLTEILEMIVAWAALESMAARLATERATESEIGSLRKIAAKYNDGTLDTRISEYSDDNIRFHQRILDLAFLQVHLRVAVALLVATVDERIKG